MAQERISMRKIREILLLRHEQGLSLRTIATSLNIGSSTVGDCLSRIRALGLTWQEVAIFSEEELESALYPKKDGRKETDDHPNWSVVHSELRRKGVTLQLLWEEYKEGRPNGFQYSQFCHHYRAFAKTVDYVFRNEHRGGEKLFIDYAGMTVPVYDSTTRQVKNAQIFIATFGASNYTYAEATWSQKTEDWIASHQRGFTFFGGVPEILVPDNLKSGVTKACRYDPDINPTYHELARHYGCAVIPARARKPRDKAKVENAVLVVERWILAVLRKRQFFSLVELNQAIHELLTKLNSRPFKKMEGCRADQFANLDKPKLKPLPEKMFEISEFKIARVNINYHIEVTTHNYSVPHTYVQKKVEIRYTPTTVEVFYRSKRIASHLRSRANWGYTTLHEHMPRSHREHVAWTPERMSRWAAQAGPKTQEVAEAIMASKPHPQQAYKSILGIIRMGQSYGADRLESACSKALAISSPNYTSIKSILKRSLDRVERIVMHPPTKLPTHSNIRGQGYFLP